MSTKDVGLPAQRNPVLFRMLHSRRVRWRTAFSYAIVIITVMAVMTVAILRFFNQRMLATVTARAQTQVAAMADMPELSAAWDDPVALAGLLRDEGETVYRLGHVVPGQGVRYSGELR